MAKEWVDLYRRAQAQPGGQLCLNPEDDPDEQTWLDGNDPEHLLWMLEGFAEHGTFENVGPMMRSVSRWSLRWEYDRRKAAGERHSDIAEALAEKYGATSRTIERWLQRDKS